MSMGIFRITIQKAKYEMAHFLNPSSIWDFFYLVLQTEDGISLQFVLTSLFLSEVQIVSNHAYLGKNMLPKVRNLQPNFGRISPNLKILTKQILVGRFLCLEIKLQAAKKPHDLKKLLSTLDLIISSQHIQSLYVQVLCLNKSQNR